ncbi:MAG TPA: hypothetical protein VGF13_19210 [Verrucomicrobiae bacterium]
MKTTIIQFRLDIAKRPLDISPIPASLGRISTLFSISERNVWRER